MFRLFSKKKQDIIDGKVAQMNGALEGRVLDRSLEKNVEMIEKLFEDVDIFRLRYVDNNHDKSLKYCVAYCDGVVNASIINTNLIKPLMLSEVRASGENAADIVIHQIV